MEKSKIKKVLILGSGGLSIGQGGEFDYSGSQAIKALKEENIFTILVNPNIATIQTSWGFADRVYFLPVNADFVTSVIEKEKPNSIILGFGGQTALNCGVELYKRGVFEKYNVEILGTPIETIIATEDRKIFVKKLNEINIKTPESIAVETVNDAVDSARKIGFPIIIRVAYALGGLGSTFCENEKELLEAASKALAFSSQILIEESIRGWKEVEYEVVRDKFNNCITVCNMENVDPLGIHTGESIVVAPSQTLNDAEYHKLRRISIAVIQHLGIIGECNIQFALDPESDDYRVIEVNARLSRSSALASKATGYPLAYIAAKLSIGYSLLEIKNPITGVTKAFFEPALDYIVIKFPRWDTDKFKRVKKEIGSSMKSVGEVMAIGRSFEEVFQKGLRMIKGGYSGLDSGIVKLKDVEYELKNPSDKRIFAVGCALRHDMDINELYEKTKIDEWFLYKIKNIIDTEKDLSRYSLDNVPSELLRTAKKHGFSDLQAANILKGEYNEDQVRAVRKREGIIPVIKQIDTLAAEYPAKTNYLYITYNGIEDDIKISDEAVIVLGGGAYSIGSSVEFDWCCVTSVRTLRDLKYSTVIINYNPETVSTDYDECDRLYFEELSLERVMDIYEKESSKGIILSMGGQIPNSLSIKLNKAGVKVLGTDPKNIDRAEDRHKFSSLLDKLDIDQPEWKEVSNIGDMKKFAADVGFPVLVRPSYVLSGSAMSVAYRVEDIEKIFKRTQLVSSEYPVVVTRYITGAKEIEMDVVAKNGEIIIYGISEHIENAGVHSGDATLVTPAQRLYLETIRRIKKITRNLVKELKVTGPVNIQFIAKNNDIKIIECNLRASRSFPFVSKIYNINFIDIATKAIMDEPLQEISTKAFELDFVGIKAPQFSFTRLHGADPHLGVEMASTGEVACIGEEVTETFLKALLSTGFKLPRKNILISTGDVVSKSKFLKSLRLLIENGYKVYATKGTAKFYRKYDIETKVLYWPLEKKNPNILDYLRGRKIDLVINIPKNDEEIELSNDYIIRRTAVDFSLPLITNLQCANLFVKSLCTVKEKDVLIKAWDEFF
ncbi:carbamoyl-phosphate synthase (glutamine-hydrolyzing) large subunit [candidate division KSB1 bacterium]